MPFINPARDQFKAIYGLPMDKPACMLNLLRFREVAEYEPRDVANNQLRISGREAYELYSAAAEGVFRQAGASQVWVGQPQSVLIGPDDDEWDYAFIAYYPTLLNFVNMVKSPQYQAAARHRSAAASDSRILVCAQLEAGVSFAPLSYLGSSGAPAGGRNDHH